VAAVLALKPTAVAASAMSIRDARQVYCCQVAGRIVVAKCYPDTGRAARAARALEALGGQHGVLNVPQCLGLDLGLAVVVQEHFVGEGLGRHLTGPSPDRAIGLASAALAALHQLPAKLDSHVDRDSCFEEAEAAAARLPADRAGIATAALERARRLLCGSLQQSVPSHGDLGWSQLLDQGETVAMVDFDKAGMAERGLDLGNLFAQTVRSGLEPNRALGLMTAYAEVAGVDVSESAVGYALLILARKLDRLPERRVAQIQRTLEAILSWELAMA